MKEGWEIINFSDSIVNVIYSTKIKRKDFVEKGLYPVVSQEKELINGFWNNPKDLFNIKQPVIIFGDHTKAIKYVDFDFVLGADGVKILQPIEKIFPKYFYYFLSNIKIRDLGYSRHYRLLKAKKIYFPKLIIEQKRIVQILDKAFEAIDKSITNTEKNLHNTKEIFDSYLNEIFSNPGDDWEEKQLGEVCEIINGGTPKTKTKEYWDSEIKWITPKDLGKLVQRYVFDTPRKISELGLQKSSAKLLPINSVILSTRAPIGHLAINTSEMATNQGCRGLIPLKNFSAEYLYYFLKKSVQLLNSLGTGATFKELSKSSLSKIKIPLPTLAEQKQIVQKLDSLSSETK